ncbi:hypothetical protein Geob_2818 [Geotalea daltonii FRC-32]|uniref:Uncharacterized protein n=1 Tax=Geotalea daltonii (strain DSM 22248 / JCM 15807 / FRC-32) TaxID=316067 RepID=B9M246_GEODF|nr:hypothetical protein [Geotalea daltonii]ACM21164.1 hypothetical protein Geob_2818 [Geotalea daltonii FRC-32]
MQERELWKVVKKVKGLVASFACISICFLGSAGAETIVENGNIQSNETHGPDFFGYVSINLPKGPNARPTGYTLDISNPDDTLHAKDSSIHLSYNGEDNGGYITSAGSNNVFVSSGTAFDGTNWIPKSANGCSSMFGSGDGGFRVFNQCNSLISSNIIRPVMVMRIKQSNVDPSTTVQFRGGLQINKAIATSTDLSQNPPLTPTVAVQPACTTDTLGTLWYTSGAAGVKDSLEICAKYADGSIAWRALSF